MSLSRPSRKQWLLAIVVCAIAIGAWQLHRPSLPHVTIPGNGEVRVYAVTYTSSPSFSRQHNLHAPRLRWWLYDHLPSAVRRQTSEPALGIGSTSSEQPMLSIWWGHIPHGGQQPEIGESGDVLMLLDSGRTINLGEPAPYDDQAIPNGPGYRQIVVTPVPTDSKRLTFKVPIRGQTIRFTIDIRPGIGSGSTNLPILSRQPGRRQLPTRPGACMHRACVI